MKKVVWRKGDFELIQNRHHHSKTVFYFREIHGGLTTKNFKTFDAAIGTKDAGRLIFKRGAHGKNT